jgi:hypothetical protein
MVFLGSAEFRREAGSAFGSHLRSVRIWPVVGGPMRNKHCAGFRVGLLKISVHSVHGSPGQQDADDERDRDGCNDFSPAGHFRHRRLPHIVCECRMGPRFRQLKGEPCADLKTAESITRLRAINQPYQKLTGFAKALRPAAIVAIATGALHPLQNFQNFRLPLPRTCGIMLQFM